MVDYIGVMKAFLFFFFGIIVSSVTWYTIPIVINLLPATADFAVGLGWFTIIVITVGSIVVVPAYHIIKAVKEN